MTAAETTGRDEMSSYTVTNERNQAESFDTWADALEYANGNDTITVTDDDGARDYNALGELIAA